MADPDAPSDPDRTKVWTAGMVLLLVFFLFMMFVPLWYLTYRTRFVTWLVYRRQQHDSIDLEGGHTAAHTAARDSDRPPSYTTRPGIRRGDGRRASSTAGVAAV
jgi:hypothetical protein